MSTTYPPRLIRYAFSSKKERNAAKSSTMAPGFYGRFPTSFGLYYCSPGKDFLSNNFYIADMHEKNEDGRVQALYAVTFHKGPGSRQMTLYSTSEHGSTPMSVATKERRYGSSVAITLPGFKEEGPSYERLRYSGLVSDKYTFELHGESFELRENSKQRPVVRQLVRLNATSSDSSQVSLLKAAGSKHNENYETEVVATWKEGSCPNRDGRIATFQFSSDEIVQKLGPYWALLAVTSILAVFQQGSGVEGTMSWQEEKKLEKGYYVEKNES